MTRRALAHFIPGCKFGKRVAGKPEDGPVVLTYGAQAPVELHGRFVPVEYRPLEPAAPALPGQPGQVDEELASYTLPPGGGADEEILQVDSRKAQEGRKIVKEEREPHGFVSQGRDDHFGEGPGTEQRLA